MKLWKKDYELDKAIEAFTVGDDYLLDQELIKYDCIASIAHAKMLKEIGVLSENELTKIVEALNHILSNGLKIKQSDEDCHTAIENFLGEPGKKIHTCRSRNDQVLTALRLYEKDQLLSIESLLYLFTNAINDTIKKYGHVKIPGYTHMQKAMPTDVKTWLSSFTSATKDSIQLLQSQV